MSFKRPHIHQVDRNQQAIIDGLERHGYKVYKLGRPVDLLVATKGTRLNILLEVKNEHGKDTATDDQKKFFRDWPAQVATIWSLNDALEVLALYEKEPSEHGA